MTTEEPMLEACELTLAAGAIIDVMMGGKFDWRSKLGDSDFLESADWGTAVEYARAALVSRTPPVDQDELLSVGGDSGSREPGRKVSFAWTATSGYKHYPPYVNLTGNRLAVRGPEVVGPEGCRTGTYIAFDLPDEAIRDLRASIGSSAGDVREAIENAYREGHQTGRCDGSLLEVDEDWKKSEAFAALSTDTGSGG